MKQEADTTPMYDFSVLRSLRKREGLTIHQLSEASTVSVAVISKLERNQSKADIDTIYKLARVWGMAASELMAMAESRLAHRAESEFYKSRGFSFERVQYGNATCFQVSAPKGALVSRPEVHSDDYEICWVVQGVVEIAFAHERHTLEAGQAIQFDAIHEHTYHALGELQMILVHIRKENRF